jgi:hypothetical protein
MARKTTNWLLELTPEEGDLVLKELDKHRSRSIITFMQHKDGYDEQCLLCRACSRISLGRDYGYDSLLPETQRAIQARIEQK